MRFAAPLQPVVDPAGWTKAEVARTGDWLYLLHPDEIADLDRAVEAVERSGIALIDVGRADFVLPVLGPTLARLRRDVLDGRGFALLRGVPVARYTRLQSAIAFWGLGTHLGIPVSQNAKGHLMGHVIDISDTNDDPSGRLYFTAQMLPFHVDGVVDLVGLLCLQPAKSGGESAVVSTVTLHNEMLKRRPDLVAALAQPLERDRHGEIPAGAAPTYALPVFNYFQNHLAVSYHGSNASLRGFPGVAPPAPEVLAGLALFDELAKELCFTMAFQQGDVQLLNNHVIAHSRITAVVDDPDPARKRHLLRLRMMTPGGRPLSPGYFAFENLAPDRVPPGRRHSGAIVPPGTVLTIPLEPV